MAADTMNNNRESQIATPGGQTVRPLVNPFTTWPHDEVLSHAEAFIQRSGLSDYRVHFLKGASLAQSTKLFDNGQSGYGGMTLTSEEREALQKEFSNNRWDRFKQPKRLYFLVACCSIGAAVQGWYETQLGG
jgi:hypothetical protein